MDRVHRALATFLRVHDVSRSDRILVAVSGGADSVALLSALAAVGQRIAVGHVDHGLRADARVDAAWVAARAQVLGARCFTECVSVRLGPNGTSPEAPARRARYAALERMRQASDSAYIATGHTLDDQAETVLLRAVRGAALAGLSGIAPVDPRGVIRPLLSVRRAALVAYLDERGLAWRIDRSNEDTSIPRNRIRHQVLPALEAAHEGAVQNLAALADAARQHRLTQELRSRAHLDRCASREPGGIWIDRAAWRSLGSEDRSAAMAAMLVEIGIAEQMTRPHVERAAQLIDRADGRQMIALPGGTELHCRGVRAWLGSGPPPLRKTGASPGEGPPPPPDPSPHGAVRPAGDDAAPNPTPVDDPARVSSEWAS